MKYKVLFRIEKIELVPKLHRKLENLRSYMKEEGHPVEIEVVFVGDVVTHFEGDYSDFIDPELDIVLCSNALSKEGMKPINDRNIRTVRAGIGEIIEKKANGWIEYTIE